MRDSIEDFFDQLGRFNHRMLPGRISATIRIDLTHDGGIDHWFVTIDRGLVRVSGDDRPADCVIRTDKPLFDLFTTGEANITAAVLRNQVTVEGNLALSSVLRRMLPGPPGAHDSRVPGR